jgi:hypothetical protein
MQLAMELQEGLPAPRSLLSIVGTALLPFFDTREAALALRPLCREFRQAVAAFPWRDRATVIRGSIAGWRACFPRALAANVGRHEWRNPSGRRAAVVDADFVHFAGLRELNMGHCFEVTDAAFEHLRGVRVLSMHCCNLDSVTDAAFVHLVGVERLDMSRCSQAAITDAAFAHLAGIHALDMSCCNQATITDAAFEHLGY